MNAIQILSFVGFTLLVAIITWFKVRKADTGSQQGYFLAGRSLKAPVIAASLMLTNLSTEQLVGLSGQAYKSGMSVMGWEVTSAVICSAVSPPSRTFWKSGTIKRPALLSTSAFLSPPVSAFYPSCFTPARWH